MIPTEQQIYVSLYIFLSTVHFMGLLVKAYYIDLRYIQDESNRYTLSKRYRYMSFRARKNIARLYKPMCVGVVICETPITAYRNIMIIRWNECLNKKKPDEIVGIYVTCMMLVRVVCANKMIIILYKTKRNKPLPYDNKNNGNALCFVSRRMCIRILGGG